MEAKPLEIVPSSRNNTSGGGGGPQKKIEMGHLNLKEGKKVHNVVVKQEKYSSFSSSSSCTSTVQLHLGVAASHLQPLVITEAQRCELDHQVFIFNHLASNIPLPHHLLQFPSTMLEHSQIGFGCGSMVNPEPHRCRRTDGKKWRCGKNVVPDQKYCERHMHRGRNNRSRKPVEETSQVSSTKPSGNSDTKLVSKTELAVSNPNLMVVQPSETSSIVPSRSLYNVNVSSANNKSKNIVGSAESRAAFAPAYVVSPGYTFASYSNMAYVCDNRSCLNICKKDHQSKSCISNNISIRNGVKGSIVSDSNGISTGIGFSPRSVLLGSGCNPSYINNRNIIEPEPDRCRRTDGKKWRCKSAVLPGQKYCATHMHRGAKKRFTNHEVATTTATTTASVTNAQLPYSSVATNIQKATCTIPNTKQSMPVPPSAPPFIQCNDEKSSSSCDSDTTISDTINTINEYSYVSFLE